MSLGASSAAISTEAHPFPAAPARLDPTDPGVWDDGATTRDGVPAARAGMLALLPSLVLGVAMLTIMYVVSAAYDLPVRDADGILGSRLGLLVGTIAAFVALDIVPRAGVRCGWRLSALPATTAAVARERWSWKRLAIVLLGIVAFYMTYLAYRNLKSFLPLITPQDLDPDLLRWEQDALGGTHPFDVLHTLLGTGVAAQVLSWVYLFFLAFVPISLGASLLASINPLPGLWWVLTLGVNWTLGTLSYYLVPTMGPFFVAPELFSNLPDTGVSRLQNALWVERLQVLADPTATSAVQSIAGFASLHASITFSAALIATLLGLHRILRIALWVMFGLTMLATVYFGWHYVLDDIAGLAIGGFAVWISALLTGNRAALRRRKELPA
jgi:membrane-associated phospholipid phosphatase